MFNLLTLQNIQVYYNKLQVKNLLFFDKLLKFFCFFFSFLLKREIVHPLGCSFSYFLTIF